MWRPRTFENTSFEKESRPRLVPLLLVIYVRFQILSKMMVLQFEKLSCLQLVLEMNSFNQETNLETSKLLKVSHISRPKLFSLSLVPNLIMLKAGVFEHV
jgi:hypothetical protein